MFYVEMAPSLGESVVQVRDIRRMLLLQFLLGPFLVFHFWKVTAARSTKVEAAHSIMHILWAVPCIIRLHSCLVTDFLGGLPSFQPGHFLSGLFDLLSYLIRPVVQWRVWACASRTVLNRSTRGESNILFYVAAPFCKIIRMALEAIKLHRLLDICLLIRLPSEVGLGMEVIA